LNQQFYLISLYCYRSGEKCALQKGEHEISKATEPLDPVHIFSRSNLKCSILEFELTNRAKALKMLKSLYLHDIEISSSQRFDRSQKICLPALETFVMHLVDSSMGNLYKNMDLDLENIGGKIETLMKDYELKSILPIQNSVLNLKSVDITLNSLILLKQTNKCFVASCVSQEFANKGILKNSGSLETVGLFHCKAMSLSLICELDGEAFPKLRTFVSHYCSSADNYDWLCQSRKLTTFIDSSYKTWPWNVFKSPGSLSTMVLYPGKMGKKHFSNLKKLGLYKKCRTDLCLEELEQSFPKCSELTVFEEPVRGGRSNEVDKIEGIFDKWRNVNKIMWYKLNGNGWASEDVRKLLDEKVSKIRQVLICTKGKSGEIDWVMKNLRDEEIFNRFWDANGMDLFFKQYENDLNLKK